MQKHPTTRENNSSAQKEEKNSRERSPQKQQISQTTLQGEHKSQHEKFCFTTEPRYQEGLIKPEAFKILTI